MSTDTPLPPAGRPKGWLLVGERGPTLVNLPRGSRVLPNNVRVSSRIFEPAPSIAADALEAFNRASHSDALREMQMVPAESLQPVDEQPVITIRFGLGLAVLSAALLGAHLAWLRAGMPGPHEILSRLMETLNV